MITDFFFFIILLVIALFAYGTSAQALLYPNDHRFSFVLEGIMFRPIMNIFGEMFLGEVHGYAFEGLPGPDPGPGDEYCSTSTNSSAFKSGKGLNIFDLTLKH